MRKWRLWVKIWCNLIAIVMKGPYYKARVENCSEINQASTTTSISPTHLRVFDPANHQDHRTSMTLVGASQNMLYTLANLDWRTSYWNLAKQGTVGVYLPRMSLLGRWDGRTCLDGVFRSGSRLAILCSSSCRGAPSQQLRQLTAHPLGGTNIQQDKPWINANKCKISLNTAWNILRINILWHLWVQKCGHELNDTSFCLG